MDYQVDWFDGCDSDTWSILWIEDFLKQLGYDRDSGKHEVFWCQPGRTLGEGMKEMKSDADCLAMIAASTQHKNLLLIIDHGDTLNNLVRDDVVVQGVPELPKVITPRKDNKGKEQATSPKVATMRSKRSNNKARGLFSKGSSSQCAGDDVEEQDAEKWRMTCVYGEA